MRESVNALINVMNMWWIQMLFLWICAYQITSNHDLTSHVNLPTWREYSDHIDFKYSSWLLNYFSLYIDTESLYDLVPLYLGHKEGSMNFDYTSYCDSSYSL